MMNVQDTSKDNMKARIDLNKYYMIRKQNLCEIIVGKFVKPNAKYHLMLKEWRITCGGFSN